MNKSRIKFTEILDNVVPLSTLPDSSFHIVNVVGIVHLLGIDAGICIESLSLYLGGMVKFAPKNFAAAIIRTKDIISTTTCLCFRSGKLVCVGALTKYHSLLVCQTYRQLIEKVVGVYRLKNSMKLCSSSLEGRMLFNNWGLQNIVGYDDLNCKPNLKFISDVIPEIAEWNPELFPGLKLLVWIKSKHQCTCKKKKKNKSCQCNVRVLLFDTGKYVVMGSTTVSSIVKGANYIKEIFSDDIYRDNDLNKDNLSRFEARKQKIKNDAYLEFEGFRSYKKTTMVETDKPMNINMLMKGLKKLKTKQTIRIVDEEEQVEELLLSPFLRACKYDQLHNVEFISSFDKNAVKEALKYCEENEEVFPARIMTILKENAL